MDPFKPYDFEKLTSLKNIIAIPAVTIAIPIRDVSHDFANSVDKSKLGRYGLLTLVNKFGASGYCKSKVHNENISRYLGAKVCTPLALLIKKSVPSLSTLSFQSHREC